MNSGHRPDIQGLRALAVILVVLYHANVPAFTGGFVGVDMFFVISGYVIGASLLREIDATGTIKLRRFYERRVRRLLPAFAVAALFTLAFAMLLMPLGQGQTNTAETGLAATFSVANLYLMSTGGRYFSSALEDNPFLHTWSLGVEEQFYLVVPALIALTLVAARRRSAVVGMLAVLTSASFVFGVQATSVDPLVAFYHPGSRFWEIGVGMLLAAAPAITEVGRPFADLVCASAVVVLCGVSSAFSDSTGFPGLAALIPVATTVVLVVFLPWSGLSRPAGSTIATWIGDRSYGWYLWHWPFIVFTGEIVGSGWPVLLMAGCAAVLPTLLSYRFIEQPVRAGRVRFAGWRLPLTAAAVAVFLAALSGASAAGAERRWGVDSLNFKPDGLARELGCDTTYEPDSTVCTIERGGKVRLMLVGDSHAQAASRGLALAAGEVDATVTIYTYDSCTAFQHPFYTAQCEGYRTMMWQLVDVVRPTHLIVSQTTERLTDGRYDPRLWWDGLRALEAELDALGIDLVILGDVPGWESVTIRRQSLLEPDAVPSTRSRRDFESYRAPIATRERAIADAWLDPVDTMCDESTCSTLDGDGDWLYYDGDHLNDVGSERLGRVLVEQLRKLE